MAEQKLKFEFTIAETNAILQMISQGPYAQVADLINNIKEQAAPQVQEQAPAVPAAPPQE